MIFYENCLLADNSHEISYPIFFRKLGKMLQNVSAAAMIGAFRGYVVTCFLPDIIYVLLRSIISTPNSKWW